MADIGDEWHAAGDDEDDEDDFIPGRDDELEDDYVDEDGDEDDEEEEFPSLLEGELFFDPSKGGSLCFEQEGRFCLVCQDSTPHSMFQLAASPALNTPLKFAGWIQSPTTWYEFEVVFSERQDSDVDDMEAKFLKAQDELKLSSAVSSKESGAIKGGKSTGEDEEDADLDQKAPAKASLKAPPSYAVDDGKKAAETDAGDGDDETDKMTGSIFAVQATQVGGDKLGDDDSRTVTFHGSFRRPSTSDEVIFVICPVKLSFAGAASPAAPAAAAASGVASSRKRSRSARNDEDDESVVEEDKGGVWNELIGLHDDAHLSTEQLRAKYYGGGGSSAGGKMDDNRKKPPPSKPPSKPGDDDDDDDDDIGF